MVAKTGAVIFAPSVDRSLSPTNIFAPASTPVESIFELPLLVLSTTAAIFSVVFSLLAHAVLKFRRQRHGDGREPAQVYEGNQLDLAWTILPVLIVLVLFLATAQELRAETSNQY
jgi:cytochrome c oxidase subunit 2